MAVIEEKLKIKNAMGLHTRPATEIVKLLQNCSSDVEFTYRKESVNAKSILSILMLAAGKNAVILVKVDGEDAKATMAKLKAAFENNFGEG
ncbi:MAG: HPr family phosphocarrier protein [Chlamydiia bacterium]|nr:HPr family phosphocarrier protein [Chlamydiia bacterium]